MQARVLISKLIEEKILAIQQSNRLRQELIRSDVATMKVTCSHLLYSLFFTETLNHAFQFLQPFIIFHARYMASCPYLKSWYFLRRLDYILSRNYLVDKATTVVVAVPHLCLLSSWGCLA
ncbi:hypothetical protein SAY86_021528 [Trapa natans]|uniref:Uncharacterized protein n=1 Tax=Trapa natans TaxID=22666 RepID=A0AAN7MCB4_TRANT|nr:hypothetical protein SAY86_021528 [Trapa natans]